MLARILLLPLFLLVAAHALAVEIVCLDLLKANLGHVYALEQQILSSVTPDAIDVGKIRALSLNKGVYLLPLKSGNQVVLRLQGHLWPPTFEHFASRFIQAAPGGNTPSIRVLKTSELEPLLPLLRNIGAQLHAPVEGTLAVYFAKPLEIGQFYLDASVGSRLRSEMAEFAKMARNIAATPRSANYQKRLRVLWLETNAEALATVIKDLRTHFPELKDATDELLLASFIEQAPSFLPTRLDDFEMAAWDHLQPEIQTQLADHWALFTALAIPDFHWSNWLVHSGQVLAIDAALQSRWFTSGSKNIAFPMQQSPIDGGMITAALRTKLIKAISPKLIEYFKGLTAQDLNRIAKESEFLVGSRAVQGTLDRIQAILKAR